MLRHLAVGLVFPNSCGKKISANIFLCNIQQLANGIDLTRSELGLIVQFQGQRRGSIPDVGRHILLSEAVFPKATQ
jgi:hypothetical protein